MAELKKVTSNVAFSTHNELAVELIRVALRMLDAKELQIPGEILEMRAKMRGESESDPIDVERSKIADALLSPDFIEMFLQRASEQALKKKRRK